MTRDIMEGVSGCTHCNLANSASHEAQLKLHTLACDVPFDVVFLDVWTPGDIIDKSGTVKVLTFICCMTGFAMAAFLDMQSIDSEAIATTAVGNFFNFCGLPRLIVVDAGGEFAGVFKGLFELLLVPVDPVSRGNHKAVRNERFHRYLNKVQRINTADTGNLFRWKQGVLFGLYAWNAAPIDGTDISRSSAAINRDFPFPIDLDEAVPRSDAPEGQQALDHFEAASPLLYKQRQILDILNSERRLRHTELRNAHAKGRSFSPGDLVIVRKQVKSSSKKQISAKLVFKSKHLGQHACQVEEHVSPPVAVGRLADVAVSASTTRSMRALREPLTRMLSSAPAWARSTINNSSSSSNASPFTPKAAVACAASGPSAYSRLSPAARASSPIVA